MELSELTAYVKRKYNIEEQHKWAAFPGFSVLSQPDTGKWLALLMRQWDSESGRMIERCDIKCGPEILKKQKSYLMPPVRMKGRNWVGVAFETETEEDVVYSLFDRAIEAEERRQSYNVIIENTQKSSDIYTDTLLPVRRGMSDEKTKDRTNRNDRCLPNDISFQTKKNITYNRRDQSKEKDISDGKNPQGYINFSDRRNDRSEKWDLEAGAGMKNNRTSGQTAFSSVIPEKIRDMIMLYEYGGDAETSRAGNFLRQARFMEDYEDDEPWFGEFKKYYPTYHDLNYRQLRGYFTWRTNVRKGEFGPVSTSMAYIYIYELLAGVGADSPEDTLSKMEEFEKGFLGSGFGDTSMKRNLKRWMFDFAILRNLPAETVIKYADEYILAYDAALAVLREPLLYSDEEVFKAACMYAEKVLINSHVYKNDNERAMHLFAEVWRYLTENYERDGRDIFTDCFGQIRTGVWNPLYNAVYFDDGTMPDRDYILNPCRSYYLRNGVWQVRRYEKLYFDLDRFNAVFHESDRIFRKTFKTGHYLKARSEEAWVTPYVESVIESERKKEIEAKRPRINIDYSSLGQIRKDAGITRDSLLIEPENTGTISGIPLQTPEEGMQISTDKNHESRADDTMHETVLNTSSGQADIPADPVLDEIYMQILLKIIRDEDIHDIIRSNLLMPNIITDTINEALFDEIGDNVLECDGDNITLVEDYREDVLNLLS